VSIEDFTALWNDMRIDYAKDKVRVFKENYVMNGS